MKPAPTMTRFPVSDHCDGWRFHSPHAVPLPRLRDLLRWHFTPRPSRWPSWIDIAPRPPPPAPAVGTKDVSVAWVNHATFLLQTDTVSLLTDPVFSDRIGLMGRIGPRRVHAPGIAPETLPKIDAILLSHDHYDHCDLPALARLSRAHDPVAIAPLGNRDLLLRAGFKRIVELDWWQTHELRGGLRIALTPAEHWSNRVTGSRCGRLWGGFFITTAARRIYFAGDTAYHPELFKHIATQFGAPDCALLPIGAYEPRWFMRSQHVNPAEAVQIHRDLGARRSVGMHWGTFQLTDEAREAPAIELSRARMDAGLSEHEFFLPEPGGAFVV